LEILYLLSLYLMILDPTSGKVISTAPEFEVADTQLAIDAAAAAFPSFRATTGRQRAKLLRKWYDLMVCNGNFRSTRSLGC
jgi:succinate-semialdehyde dehydrogenase/glutarate-semialdehyde dehydrogenase